MKRISDKFPKCTRSLAPMSREEFAELQRGQKLRDRKGWVWTVIAETHQEHGLEYVVVRSGDLVRRVNERRADDYALPSEDG